MVTSDVSVGAGTGYTEVLYWKIADTSGRLLKIQLMALPLALVFGLGFGWIARRYASAPKLDWDFHHAVVFIMGIFVVLAIHELTHGAVMLGCGAIPRFGFWPKGGLFYAKAPGFAFTHRQYVSILLAPLVTLSLLACAVMLLFGGTFVVWYAALWAVVNATAANADLWITAVVLRYPARAYIVDELNGVRVLMPTDDYDPP